MSAHEFLSVAKDHAHCHHGLFTLVLRVLLYSLGMMVSMLASDECFDGSRSACVSCFLILSATIELLWNRAHCGGRFLWYVACVAGIAASGLNMMHQATTWQKCQACGQKPATTRVQVEKGQ